LARAFLCIGSNIENRASALRTAVERLNDVPSSRVAAASSIYETEPWGKADQAAFLNQAVEMETALEPERLLEFCKAIERGLGRRRTVKWGPRTIDIDILLYDGRILEGTALRIPHPRLRERRFALAPLAEIAPDAPVPGTGHTVAELLEACEDRGGVRLYDSTVDFRRVQG
jgi:2-amino-4-hydroxy-6-hydroxymethyldihydropteridine diphosphokinase